MRLLAKLVVILVALGATGLGLLSLRQQRYEVSNAISKAHNEIVDQERTQWRLRAEIASRCDPADIRGYAERLDLDLTPMQQADEEAARASTETASPDGALGSRSPAGAATAKQATTTPSARKSPSKSPSKSSKGSTRHAR
jgi:hypothetical protein